MKTKIKSLIAIFALGIIGFTNINAIADNKGMVNAELVIETEESLTIESWMLDENYWENEEVAITPETEDSLEVESWMTEASLWE